MDAGLSAADAGHISRELRLALHALHEMAPPKQPGDFVDDIQARRDKRMRDAAGQ